MDKLFRPHDEFIFCHVVLFILVIVLLHKRMEATEAQLQAIKEIAASTEDLTKSDYFIYRPDYKKYVLNVQGKYPKGKADLNDIIAPDKEEQLSNLENAGKEIQKFLSNHSQNQYVLIVEGQASRDPYLYNYELSYQRALALMRFWVEQKGISFENNCEILISGSGDGKLDTHSMRESVETENQRFLIHILPKNIFESTNENK